MPAHVETGAVVGMRSAGNLEAIGQIQVLLEHQPDVVIRLRRE